MKKKIFIMLIIVISCFILGYVGVDHYRMKVEKQEALSQINKVIKKAGIPKKDLTTKSFEKYNDKVGTWYIKTITTNKDHDNWKKKVLANNQYLSGKAIKNSSSLKSVKHTEIDYAIAYYPKGKQVWVYYNYGDKQISSKEKIAKLFAYEFPEKYIAYPLYK